MSQTDLNIGALNGHAVGRILKEAVRRASATISNQRIQFEAQTKAGYAGDMDDVFTSADTSAQEVYLRTFRECFPACGVIAEENALTISATPPVSAYFTVDPLDGTKAFVRRQSHGVATMVAMVVDGTVAAAFIGDINTDEVYGYRPGSEYVHRITRLDTFERLAPAPLNAKPLGETTALLRDPALDHAAQTQSLIASLKTHQIMGASIGTWMARLWKQEIDLLIIPQSFETPWDSTPIQGITEKLGYVYLRNEGSVWRRFKPGLLTATAKRPYDVVICPPSYLETDGTLKLPA